MAFFERRFFTVDEALQQVLDGHRSDSDGERCADASPNEPAGSSSGSDSDDEGESLVGDAKRACVRTSSARPPPIIEEDSDGADWIFNDPPEVEDVEERGRLLCPKAHRGRLTERQGTSSDESSDSDGGGDSGGESGGVGDGDSDREDPELRLIRQTMRKGCGCKGRCGEAVNHYAPFDPCCVFDQRLSLREFDKGNRDLYLMTCLQAGASVRDTTLRGRSRQRQRYDLAVQGNKVCTPAFLFLHDFSTKYYRAVRCHFETHGPVPREHGNKGKKPHHALTFPRVRNVVLFLVRYAERYGIPQPAAPRGRGDTPPVYLSAALTNKVVHQSYVASCREQNPQADPVKLSSFRNIWRQCLPHVKVATPRTDVCQKCEDRRQAIRLALTEYEKIDSIAAFGAHMQDAQAERDHYKALSQRAREELDEYVVPAQRPAEGTADLHHSHYTFDFAQQVTLPGRNRQVGPIYFKTPFRVQVFAVCNEGLPQQVNYLLGEDQTIGENGSGSHGPNTVISLLHHYLEHYGMHEEEMNLHADNCSGQNKNKTMLAYLLWRTLTGRHSQISLSFMIVGHTRCLVDACFGLFKKLYRRSNTDTVAHLADVAERSASVNSAHQFDDPEKPVRYYQWDAFFLQYFKPLKGISQMHHFEANGSKPGVMTLKKSMTGAAVQTTLFKKNVTKAVIVAAGMPPLLTPGGLSQERKLYLWKNVREHFHEDFRDQMCPDPAV